MDDNIRIIKNLNFDWEYCSEFKEDMLLGENKDYKFEKVNIPHTAVETPYNNFDEKMYQIECCYRKNLFIPDEMIKKTACLCFDGVMTYAKVYVNGIFVGDHKGGYTPFKFDISKSINYGQDNLIAVYVDCHERKDTPPFGFVVDYLTYGGIYREVRLEYINDITISNCHVKTKKVLEETKLLDLDIYVENINGKKGRHSLNFNVLFKDNSFYKFNKEIELSGENKQIINVTEHIEKVCLWDIDNPNLYKLQIELKKDETIYDRNYFTFGFRQVEYKEDGLYLNGGKIKLRGLNRHQSFPYVGYAMPKSAQYKDAEILKYDLGVNTVRLSHYPQSNHFMDKCDELGLLVFDEIPGWQHIGDSKEWRNLALTNVEDMIMKDWNHPSVFIWGVRINESADCEELYKKTNALAHKLDETRPTGGVRYMEGSQLLEDVYTFNDFSHTGKNNGLKGRKSVAKSNAPYLVTEHNGHMYPTKKFDSEPHRIKQAKRHLNVLEAMYKDNDISGSIGWCMFDYNTHKDFGSGDKICYHGVTDMFRIEKYAAYVYSSMQDTTPVMHVANAMEIGDFPASALGDTYIFTNCDYVKVYKNDLYIDCFYPAKDKYPSVPHAPVIVNSYIGSQIHDNENFSIKDADFIKNSFIKVSKGGDSSLSLNDKLKMGILLLKYKLSFSDSYQLYGKYMSNWGSAATTYKYDGYINDKLVLTEYKSQLGTLDINVYPDSTNLIEDETYDVTRVVIKLEDKNKKIPTYSSEFISVETQGPISLIGPKNIPLIGGSSAFWIKTKGQSGEASVVISSELYGEKTVKFNIVKQ
ncbi:MAG: glycoside hydrolase family 2 TIM barrel-domain containing protein [Clostridiaceae bacterium]